MCLKSRFPGATMRRAAAAVLALMLATGCTLSELKDCPAHAVLGVNTPGSARLRTSHYRVMLQRPELAAARFLPYALMSAYAYRLGDGCQDPGNKDRVSPQRAAQLEEWLAATTDSKTQWQPAARHGLPGGCEDDTGLMFHVWERTVGRQTWVAMAFRGTSGAGDWRYGNLWPVAQKIFPDNQLSRASRHAGEIIDAYLREAERNGNDRPRFITTGHSLGGGLAQHVLYAHPDRIEQAIVFDPSSITGFTGIDAREQREGCMCWEGLAPEGRMLRIYQTYEILSDLRIWHKIAFPPERHVQEVRFPFDSSWNPVVRHGMQEFATNLHDHSGPPIPDGDHPAWYASQDESCTRELTQAQAGSCSRPPAGRTEEICPR